MLAPNEILSQIENDITALRGAINHEQIQADLDNINTKLADENLWNDADSARKLLQKKSSLEKQLTDLNSLTTDFQNLNELYQMAPTDPDVISAIESLAERANAAKFITLFNGPNDKNDAFLFSPIRIPITSLPKQGGAGGGSYSSTISASSICGAASSNAFLIRWIWKVFIVSITP